MSQERIHACLIVDDFPLNATYWWREQQKAFGYKPPDTGAFGENWLAQGAAPLCPLSLVREFADFVEKFGVRGKLTLLPYPGGLGRIDREVRGYSNSELGEIVGIVRDRLAPCFDITPEVLTHSMAMDPTTEALRPHAETAWLTYLAAERQQEELQAYLRAACRVLADVGIVAHGVTMGGMTDASGIGKGESLLNGHHRGELAEAMLAVEREFDPRTSTTFVYTGAPAQSEASRTQWVPEVIYSPAPTSRVFELHSRFCDPLLPVFHGKGDVETETARWVSPDLEHGEMVDGVEKGGALTITVHAQTLTSINTGLGFQVLREMVRRLTERYGSRLVWHTALELCEQVGVQK
jgi:hypothetical protein